MGDLIVKEKPRRRLFSILAGGCLIVLFILLLSTTIILGYKQNAIRNSPSPTPTVIPTPHILVREPADRKTVRYENFSSNQYNWSLYYSYGKIETINGKLILQSSAQQGYIIGTSEMFVPLGETYYIQADFNTDTDKASPYGLVFGLNRILNTYYAFEIWPSNGGFRLLKSNSGKWYELIPYSQHAISPYPESTTLSVYFDEGNIELYINGELVSTFSDTDFFQSKEAGVFVSKSGYRLIVDDFFIYYDK